VEPKSTVRLLAVAAALSLAGCTNLNSGAPESAASSTPKPVAAEPATKQDRAASSAVDLLSYVAPGQGAATSPEPDATPTAGAAARSNREGDEQPPAAAAGGASALSAYPDEGPNPLRPLPFQDAVARAADALFEQARPLLGNEKRRLVIDPLVDGGTGQQTASTVEMGRKLSELMRRKYPSLTPGPLTRASLAERPVLFIGTLTPFNTDRSSQKPANAFRVWLTLIDLRTGKIVAKAIDKATATTVDAVPLSFYRDSPTWPRDRTVAAYINSCTFKSKVGDAADPAYLARLPAAAAINEAMEAYSSGQVEQANKLFVDAANLADEDDLRILNGLYLTSWKLGYEDQARAAFDRIVTAGLHARRLPLKFLFVPAKTTLLQTGDLGPQYSMWLHELAQLTGREGACLHVVGHTSKTGGVALNDALSYARANSIRDTLAMDQPELARRLTAQGKGFRENLIGLGTDDLRDALDRRVELLVTSCSA
jgi:outer membrane protein OmpA-like peptidoglycan-associated protein